MLHKPGLLSQCRTAPPTLISSLIFKSKLLKSSFIIFIGKVLHCLSLEAGCLSILSRKVSYNSSSSDADEISLFSALTSSKSKFSKGGKCFLCYSSMICNIIYFSYLNSVFQFSYLQVYFYF